MILSHDENESFGLTWVGGGYDAMNDGCVCFPSSLEESRVFFTAVRL